MTVLFLQQLTKALHRTESIFAVLINLIARGRNLLVAVGGLDRMLAVVGEGHFAAISPQLRVAGRADPDGVVQVFRGQGRAVFRAVGAKYPSAVSEKIIVYQRVCNNI